MRTVQDPNIIQRPDGAAVPSFPRTRSRRVRRHPQLRRLLASVDLRPDTLVAPLFVRAGLHEPAPIASLIGHSQHTIDSLVRATAEVVDSGVRATILFGIPERKDPMGRQAFDDQGIVQRSLRRLKQEFRDDLVYIADLCLCEYTDHGHCGYVRNGQIDNDRTLEIYQQIAVAQAAAGADVIAPSGMMDGQVKAIRDALDAAGYADVPILAYSVKYASALYAPFREAVRSTPRFGDRRAYQMDPLRLGEASWEVRLDIEEGADIIMVKPALPYLDVVAGIRARFDVPLAAFHVSGEYAMIKAAAMNGWIDESQVALEVLTAIKRAGADMIITYFAQQVGQWRRQ